MRRMLLYTNLGLIGTPLSHSLSPTLHTYFLSSSGINGGYSCFDIKESEIIETIELFKKFNFKGFNITVPHKFNIFPYLDDVTHEAKTIGAVNTVLIDTHGKLKGYNTDIDGVIQTFAQHHIGLDGQSIFILGSGESTKTVVSAVKKVGNAQLTVLARNPFKAEEMCHKLEVFDCNIKEISALNNPNDCDIIINTTSLGLKGEPFLNLDHLNCGLAAIDLQYNPKGTSFLKAINQADIAKIDGMTMLIYQGLKAFELWTNTTLNIDRNEIMKRLGVA